MAGSATGDQGGDEPRREDASAGGPAGDDVRAGRAGPDPDQPDPGDPVGDSTDPDRADAAGASADRIWRDAVHAAGAPGPTGGGTGGDRPSGQRVVLTDISSRAWEHPADRGALTALRELKGFDEVLKAVSGIWNERAWRLRFLGGAIRVDHRQYPRLHRLYTEAATALDVPEPPELYVQNDRALNAMAVGMRRPFIVVNTGLVELADDDELRCLFGHELGHVRSGHAVYRTMIIILTNVMLRLAWLPVGAVVLNGILAALYEWWRKAELSADRAGLLACQDPAASLRLSMKLAGGGDLSEVDTAAFLDQATEYERAGDLRDSVLKLVLVAYRSHPMPVARAAELRRWVDSGAYRRILSGDYPRRADDATASMSEDARQAAASYREAFARSEDPLFTFLRRAGDSATDLGAWVGSGMGRVWGWVSSAGRSARAAAAGDAGAGDAGTDRHG